jgi:hypothetical protein
VIEMTDTSVHSAATSVKRHPIAAVVWGIIGGIGLSLFLMGRAQIPVGKWTAPIIIVVIMIALNLVWAYFGPAKKPKGQAPSTSDRPLEPEPMDDDESEPEEGGWEEATSEAPDGNGEA